MNADPRVMEHFPKPLARVESDALAARIRAMFDQFGFGLWAVAAPGVTDFAGFVGLNPCRKACPSPRRWRSAGASRRRIGAALGYRGARAPALSHAFGPLGLSEVVSFTVPGQPALDRGDGALGLVRDPAGDFEHTAVPQGHPLGPHVLYFPDRPGGVGSTGVGRVGA